MGTAAGVGAANELREHLGRSPRLPGHRSDHRVTNPNPNPDRDVDDSGNAHPDSDPHHGADRGSGVTDADTHLGPRQAPLNRTTDGSRRLAGPVRRARTRVASPAHARRTPTNVRTRPCPVRIVAAG